MEYHIPRYTTQHNTYRPYNHPNHYITDTQIRYDDIATKAVEGIRYERQYAFNQIPEININPHVKCEHEPNLLEHRETIEYPDYQIDIYQCTDCGEIVTDIRSYRDEDYIN